ncbi:hypothetical protein AQUCO_03000231v1 [Aquilegia coerulea]|uniref:Ferritin n=1 Tax=Aquilegia coerulea TaxID=218851 RepID=A0A2G5D1Y1_AQUCA|nr:hypothetical protein AQUCO_03000231v1 [Aquilegia coerulea]
MYLPLPHLQPHHSFIHPFAACFLFPCFSSSSSLFHFSLKALFSSSIMLLRAPSSSFALSTIQGENFFSSSVSGVGVGGGSSSCFLPFSGKKQGHGFVVCAAKESNSRPLTGIVFEPFEEVKNELFMVPTVPQQSLARQLYTDESEAAINEQIKFFKEASEEERGHAEKFMEYQNKRGGRVKLQSIVMPLSEFDHAEKGDALYAMELALSLEKLTNEKLLNLHRVADKNKDVQLADFVESEFLTEQVEAIKKISEFVAQLRRVGKGHGVWHFDQMLLEEGVAA